MSIAPWLIAHYLRYALACFKGFVVYYYSGLSRFIHHVKMQLNGAIKILVSGIF